MSEISRFALFLAKKHTQNTMHLPEKTFTFCENCRSIIRGFHINNVWNLTFCSIFSEKKTHTQKKHDAPSWKNRHVFWKLLFYYKGFPSKLCLKSHVLLYFWRKKTDKKHDARSWKKCYVLWKLPFYNIRGFHWSYVWNLTFCSIFDEKHAYKTRYT